MVSPVRIAIAQPQRRPRRLVAEIGWSIAAGVCVRRVPIPQPAAALGGAMLQPLRSLSESAALKILHRATEIDATEGGTIDITVLRQSAVEAGIAEAAVDRALIEYEAAEERQAAFRRWTYRLASGAAAGLGLFGLFVLGLALSADVSVVDAIRDLLDLR